MECPNCSFQNTPGTRACARCQSLLDLAAVAIAPPRRADRSLAAGAGSILGVPAFRLRDRLADLGRSIRFPPAVGVTWSDIAWSILPGLAQVRRGRRDLGLALLGSWVFLWVAAIATIGSGIALMCCFGAVSIHCLAVSLLLTVTLQPLSFLTRAMIGIALYGAVFAVIYAPARYVARGLVRVTPATGLRSTATIEREDILLYSGRWTSPSRFDRGDLVVFEIPAFEGPGVMVAGGLGVDRVVGIPGDRVEIDAGRIRVNGDEVPRELQPIGGTRGAQKADFVAGPGEYIIIPSTLGRRGHGDATVGLAPVLSRIARVPEDRIRGEVLGRLRPWSRAGPLRGSIP